MESVYYSYSFSEELQQEWTWSERFAPQAEILAYINHVADRFDLRRHFRFGTKVTSANWLPDERLWELTLDSGDTCRGRYLLAGSGGLSTPKDVDVPGMENFTGLTVSTSRWTVSLDELAGKRVAVIGTGSSGVQCIPLIAEVAAHLTVFQRTPNYVFPPATPRCPRRPSPRSRAGTPPSARSAGSPGRHPGPPRDRLRLRRLRRGALGAVRAGLRAQRIPRRRRGVRRPPHRSGGQRDRGSVRTAQDPADRPRSAHRGPAGARFHPLGAKRSCFGTDYYETFNRPNVSLVSLREEPITTMTSGSIVTEAGSYHVDAIVLAIGFDAFTGPLYALNVTTPSGRLQDAWRDGVRTYLGIMTAGFPNFFMIGGPQSPALASNVVVTIEQAVDWITDLIAHAKEEGADVVEATPEAQDDWVTITEATVDRTLYATTDSWYRGSNVTGKPATFLGYVGGVGKYRRMCTEIAKRGYPGVRIGDEAVALRIGRIDEEIA